MHPGGCAGKQLYSGQLMIQRFAVPLAVSLIVGLGTISLWLLLRQNNETQIARIAEAQSYATRSELIRNIETLVSALQNARAYWTAYGHLPRDQWAMDAAVELDHFKGLTMLLWDDPARGKRYARTPEYGGFDHRPSDEEWNELESLISRARTMSESRFEGPLVSDQGDVTFTIFLRGSLTTDSGTLIAVIDAPSAIGSLLVDESPGYAINVYSGEVQVFSRGAADVTAPDSWTREGLIKSSLGTLWRVVHRPTVELSKSYESPAIDTVLLLGLIVAVLLGTLTFENSRARSRATAAEVAEKKLAELNRNLEQEVAERTGQLAERTADLETLADSVTHDLRNPLNIISVNVQLLEEVYGASLGSEGTEILKCLSPPVQQMVNILDRLLGLTAVSHSIFKRENICIRKLARDIASDLTISESMPVTVQVNDVPDAFADKTLVSMILVNLLGNAIKYTRQNECRVIEVGHILTDGFVAYSVRDNGIGFDQDDAERLFVAFSRLDAASSVEGVGLGLTIVARAVQRHGGKIWAEGQPGKGATFYFTLDAVARGNTPVTNRSGS